MDVSLTSDGINITASQGTLDLDVHETLLLMNKLNRLESALFERVRSSSKSSTESEHRANASSLQDPSFPDDLP